MRSAILGSSPRTGILTKTRIDNNALSNSYTYGGLAAGCSGVSGATAAGPHAVTSLAGVANGVTNPVYCYDANGNMLAGAGRTVAWTGFNPRVEPEGKHGRPDRSGHHQSGLRLRCRASKDQADRDRRSDDALSE